MVNVEYSEAVTEVIDIIEHMEKEYIDKIPRRFKEFLEKNKSNNYHPQLDHSQRLKEMKLKEKTKDILAVIYKNYWCNESEKIEFQNLLKQNEKRYQEEMREKYNPDNLFKKKKKQIESNFDNHLENSLVEIPKKETFFAKLIKNIKSIFKKK